MSIKGKIFKVKGARGYFVADGYWHKLTGKSWLDSDLRNPAVYNFAIRSIGKYDNEENEFKIVYGHINGLGYLFHKDELKKIWWKGKKYYDNIEE